MAYRNLAIFVGALGLLGQAGMARAEGLRLHVAPNGQDAWNGTAERPFRTLEKARDTLRALPLERRAGATVLVQAGDYPLAMAGFELGAEDGGTAEAPVIYRAEGKVALQGGEMLAAERVSAVTHADLLARLPEAVRGTAVQLDLRHLAEAGRLRALPDIWRDPPGLTDISWNGHMLRLARWPNRDWATVTEVLSDRPPVFRYSGDQPARWPVDAGVWLHGYWFYEWIDETVRVARIDPEAREIELAVRPPYRGIGESGSRRTLRRFRAINVLEELDEPGEYWLDPERGLAIVLPPEPAETARILVSTLEGPIVRLAGTAHVELHGFVVESGRGDGIVIEEGIGNAVVGCEIRHVGGVGVRVSGRESTVRSCDIHHTGETGVDLSGGDRLTLTPARNAVVNCDIHHVGRIKQTYSPGIQLSGCGQIARHNWVHDGPHIGISFRDNDHLIEYNEITRVCSDSGDVAAIYSANSPAFRGTAIRHNFVHHVPLNVRYGAAGVYLDNALCGNVVEGNLFYRSCDPGANSANFSVVYIHHGYQNLIANNIFADSRRAVGATVYGDSHWNNYKAARYRADAEGAAGLNSEAWLAAYRDQPLPGYGMEEFLAWQYPDHTPDRLNPVQRNLVVACETAFGRSLALSDNVESNDLGLFADVAAGDFRLVRTEGLPPGFEPLPLARMGLQIDAARRALPPRQWPRQTPVARAGYNQVVFARPGEQSVMVTLDAAASQVAEGGELRSLLWLCKGLEIGRGERLETSLPIGNHQIAVRAMSQDGYWATDEVRIAVLAAEREAELTAGASPGCPPGLIALPDRYRTARSTALQVPAEDGLLANDGATPLPQLAELLETTTHGRLECRPDGSFDYMPPEDWEGVASFRYRIRVGEEFSNPVTVEITVGISRGFVWNRAAEWTPGRAAGSSEGNPDGDSLGQPVWFYGSTDEKGEKWYAAEPWHHVWDLEWHNQAGNSCWVRADDKGPFFRSNVVFQTDNQHYPILRWKNPTGRHLRLQIKGELAVGWSLTPPDGTQTTLVLASDNAGEVEVAFQETAAGKPDQRFARRIDAMLEVAPGGFVILGSRTEDTGRGWVTTTDELDYIILEIRE